MGAYMPIIFGFCEKIFLEGRREKAFKAVVFCARACYNGDMKARMTILAGAAALCAVLGLCGLGALPAAAEPAVELFLPTSYEQYLPLRTPADAAMNDSYIVVADGSGLYVYDRDAVAWSRYDHTSHDEPCNVTKVGFTPDGRLFFSDQEAHLYLYDFATRDAQIQSNISCSTFVIDGDMLYTAAVANGITTFLAYPHRGAGLSFDRARNIGDLPTSTSIAPHMFVMDGDLYCAVNMNVYVYRDNGSGYDASFKQLSGEEIVKDLTSVAVLGGHVYYTVNDPMTDTGDGVFVTDLDGAAKRLLEGDGFNSLFVFGENLYCVKGATVREIETDGKSARYTGYELAADSDSFNRLSHAGDTVRARDLLVSADCGNERVSVYNMRTGEFSLLGTGEASCVATDGEVIAAGVGTQVLLYHYGEEQPYYVHHSANAIAGVAVVFGRCYYVTEHHYGVAEEGASEFTRSNSPVALTADVYGNLYVADRQFRVLKYSEAEFLDETVEDGEIVTEEWRLPEGFRSLRAGFGGELYYLSGNVIYANGERLAAADATGCVYYGDSKPALASFALGFEDNALYLQYGNFVARTDAASFPTLSTIAATDVYGEVFSAPDENSLALVDVKAGVTGICVGADRLTETSAYFPYDGYYRTAEGGRGILLAQRGGFSLVALFENYGYTLALYRDGDCTAAPVTWTATVPSPRYTTSAVGLCYYPCISGPLTVTQLPRASELTLLATVKTEGAFDFAFVRSGTALGYVPLAYLTETPPVPELPDEYTLGYLKASEEGVLFRAGDNGPSLLVTERTQVRIYDSGNGLYFVRFRRDGVEYTAQVPARMIQEGDPGALRMSLIIVLSVVAVGVLAAFILFRPRKKKE